MLQLPSDLRSSVGCNTANSIASHMLCPFISFYCAVLHHLMCCSGTLCPEIHYSCSIITDSSAYLACMQRDIFGRQLQARLLWQTLLRVLIFCFIEYCMWWLQLLCCVSSLNITRPCCTGLVNCALSPWIKEQFASCDRSVHWGVEWTFHKAVVGVGEVLITKALKTLNRW